MSTSPSWFDQEKFSRLVKKVGKTVPLPPQDQPPATEADLRPPPDGLASTARISLVSKPPSLLSENRALPALPRRSGALPSIRTNFQPAPPIPAQSGAATPSTPAIEKTFGTTEPKAEPVRVGPMEERKEPTLEGEDLGELWQKMALLNEELAYAVQERDQALNENARLADLLRDAKANEEPPAAPVSTGKTQELHLVTKERDGARKDYVELRKQYENLKQQEQGPKDGVGKMRQDLEQQLEVKNKEIAALKTAAVVPGGGDNKNGELIAAREQLAKVTEELSVAQRGLMLSQKALHETRDTLREATEGTSLSRHNFDNLKNECATLMEQNQVLQAQNDQLTRELAAAKSKITSRL